MAAPDAADARTPAGPFADGPGERLTLRELGEDAGIATKRAMRKRARGTISSQSPSS